ncbi:MAG: hypothetical protein ACE5EF_12415, partial [Dehalococcoidia bacterium]
MSDNETPQIAMQTEATPVETPRGTAWADVDGYIGPRPPGGGPRRDPASEFPTGPDIGEKLPDIVALAADGRTIDVHADRAGRPAAVVFF